ncbi:MAG: glycoside hydrolase family 13 protein, partial [Deltaproteobacteria bacterium]
GSLGQVVRRAWTDPPLPWSEGRSLDFFGGDLVGLRERLEHVERLGADALYLTPIFQSLTNHRYDTIDHGEVDSALGGDAALEALSRELRRRGMRYLIDVVVNHVGSGHRWFNREGLFEAPGAYQREDAPSRDYFTFDRWPDRYRSWKGIDLLPKLDFRSDALREALYRSPGAPLRRWLREPFSADGYRFDAANLAGRDGEVQLHEELWEELCRCLRAERPDAYLLGEHYFDPSAIVGPGRLDGTMAYLGFTLPIRQWLTGEDHAGEPAPLDATEVATQLRELLAELGWQAASRCLLHVDTHDLPRLRTVAGEAAFRAATVLQLAALGVPCVYYGDEVGLLGGADPDNRRPMPWDEGQWDLEALGWMKAVLAARRSSPSLTYGSLWLLAPTADRLAIVRSLGRSVGRSLGQSLGQSFGGELALAIADRASSGWDELDLSGVPGAAGARLRDVATGELCRVSPEGRLELSSGRAGGRLLVEVAPGPRGRG